MSNKGETAFDYLLSKGLTDVQILLLLGLMNDKRQINASRHLKHLLLSEKTTLECLDILLKLQKEFQ